MGSRGRYVRGAACEGSQRMGEEETGCGQTKANYTFESERSGQLHTKGAITAARSRHARNGGWEMRSSRAAEKIFGAPALRAEMVEERVVPLTEKCEC